MSVIRLLNSQISATSKSLPHLFEYDPGRARRLDVSEAQVSRDERNEYYGATTEKIEAVMSAMGMKAIIRIEIAS